MGTAHDHLRSECREYRDPVGRRIGVREAAANRAPIADSPVGDTGSNIAHRPAGHIGYAPIFDIRMGDAAADKNRIRLLLDLFELPYSGDVDQEIGLHQTQIEERTER